MKVILFLSLLFAGGAYAAATDVPFKWLPPDTTVDGVPLDADGDGVYEGLTGYKFYSESGTFLDDLPQNNVDTHTLRLTLPPGRHCFKMTAYSVQGESAFSNIGACIDVPPGVPNAPAIIIGP